MTGYGFEDPYKVKHVSPLVTRGHVIKSVCRSDREVMLLTTAVMLPGMSGGCLADSLTEEPLGMAVSNTQLVRSVYFPVCLYEARFLLG